MKTLICLMLTLAACITHDTELTPRWDDAPDGDALQLWTDQVQGAINRWQGALGDDCAFPLFVGPSGPPVMLVASKDWTRHDIGSYWSVDGHVDVKGDVPDNNTVVSTLTHELGHAAGIRGHSSDPLALMYLSDNGVTKPTAADAAMLRKVLSCE